ncbi:MAG: D-2-hydroxyacid dehydrogenase [Pseudomonadota bacterium]
MSPSPLTVLLNVEVPGSVLTRARDISPRIHVITEPEFRARPAWLNEADVLYTQRIAPEQVAAAERLKWVQTFGAGVEWLLTPNLRQREDLVVTNSSGIHAQPIAEHVFGLVLMFARQLHRAVRQQAARKWDGAALQSGVTTLSGATLGIVGLGAIGRRVAAIGAAFGMHVIALKRTAAGAPGVERVFGSDQLVPFLKEAEYVVSTLPLTPQTRGYFGSNEFAAMRSDAVFINIGRGRTVDTEALLRALESNSIAGAALDVTDPEPLPEDHPLWTMENVILTPHYAGAHPGYVQRASAIFLENLARFVAGGQLTNVVDKDAGY